MDKIQLTELEYHKLMRYVDNVAALEAQAELLFNQIKVKIDSAKQLRDEYRHTLKKKYPKFNLEGSYTPVETEYALHEYVADK